MDGRIEHRRARLPSRADNIARQLSPPLMNLRPPESPRRAAAQFNIPAAPNPAIAAWLHAGHLWRGVGEPGPWLPPRHSMRTPHIATTCLIGLLAVLAAGCSRMTADEEADWRKSFGIPAEIPMKDLGEVELRAGIPKRVSVGWGKDCTITATVLTNGLVQLNLVYESKGGVIDGAKTQSHSGRSQLMFHPSTVPAGWRLPLPPIGQHSVVAIRPIIIR